MGTPRPLSRKQIQDAIAREESLEGTDMRGLDLSEMSFDGAQLAWVKFADSNLNGSTFRRANLNHASLWHTECVGCVFDEANLDEADLDMANLEGATFRDARVRKTVFPFPRTSNPRFMECVASGAPINMDRLNKAR